MWSLRVIRVDQVRSLVAERQIDGRGLLVSARYVIDESLAVDAEALATVIIPLEDGDHVEQTLVRCAGDGRSGSGWIERHPSRSGS